MEAASIELRATVSLSEGVNGQLLAGEQSMESNISVSKAEHNTASLSDNSETFIDVGDCACFCGVSVDPHLIAQLGLGTINVIATVPLLGPLGSILHGFAEAVLSALYNKEACDALKDRVGEILKILEDLLPKLERHSNINGLLQPLCTAIDDCTGYIKKFCNKGFLKKILSSSLDKEILRKLDKKLTDSVQTITIGIGCSHLDLQEQSLNKMRKMEEMIDQLLIAQAGCHTGSAYPQQIGPHILADIVAKAGTHSAGAIKDELQGVGLKLEEIGDAVNTALDKLNLIEEKLDRHHDQQIRAHEETREMQMLNREMIMTATAEAKKAHKQTLDAVMRFAEQNGSVPVTMATKRDVRDMSSKAKQLLAASTAFEVIHGHGVGKGEWKDLDGAPGDDGKDGKSWPWRAGTHDNQGQHGENGGDGTRGADGEDGLDAENFDVMIEFLSEDREARTRTYRIEHAGVRGADEYEVTIDYPDGRLLIDGTGGQGGSGGGGGNGGKGQDGGVGCKGEDGGEGGEGGDPELGGAGGNGGDGAKIRVNTNDPAVLMVLDLDCTGGLGGREGQDGEVGKRGEGGEGGAPPSPPPPRIIHLPDGSTMVDSFPVSLRAGRRGKDGKDGKKARRAWAKADGTPGKDGVFTICIYDEGGFRESGGKPYRLIFSKNDDSLQPIPHTLGQAEADGPLVYGQELKFGRTMPVNAGSLSSAPSQLVGTVTARCNGCDVVVASGMLSFPSVPAAKGTRYGELPESLASTLTLQLPKPGPPFIHAIDGSFPFQMNPAPAPDKTVVTEFKWTVDGLPFPRLLEDMDSKSSLRHQKSLIFPLRFGSVLSTPATLALDHNIGGEPSTW